MRHDVEADCRRAVDVIVDLYRVFGTCRYDEDVSQADHGAQAASLARADGAPDALIAAALLHDIGHVILLGPGDEADPSTDLGHERVGARYLARRFPASVSAPMALHVAAKRYLCAVQPAYTEQLSSASTRSLELQGGPLPDADIPRFLQQERWHDAVQLRRWDDASKERGRPVEPIESYRDLLMELLVR